MEKDLTQGKPMSIMWRFALPLFLSVVFQQLYNIADSVIAGKFISVDALAAVGASYPSAQAQALAARSSYLSCLAARTIAVC